MNKKKLPTDALLLGAHIWFKFSWIEKQRNIFINRFLKWEQAVLLFALFFEILIAQEWYLMLKMEKN